MTFSLRTFLLQSILISTAFAIVITCGEHRLGIWAILAVPAMYAASFVLFFSRTASFREGVAGAILGWAIAIFFTVVLDLCRYVIPGDAESKFDNDGPLIGLVVLPLFAFVYLLIPIAIMGGLIGWISSVIRTIVSDTNENS